MRMILCLLLVVITGCSATSRLVIKADGVGSPVFVAKRIEIEHQITLKR